MEDADSPRAYFVVPSRNLILEDIVLAQLLSPRLDRKNLERIKLTDVLARAWHLPKEKAFSCDTIQDLLVDQAARQVEEYRLSWGWKLIGLSELIQIPRIAVECSVEGRCVDCRAVRYSQRTWKIR